MKVPPISELSGSISESEFTRLNMIVPSM